MKHFRTKQINFILGLCLIAAGAAFAERTAAADTGSARAMEERIDTSGAAAPAAKAYGPTANLMFPTGSSVLTESQKNELRTFARRVGTAGIKDVTIAAWSDKSLPSEGERLSRVDRRLADRRARVVKDFLKKTADMNADVDIYNMAEGANWLSRTFRTEEAELKSVFGKRGAITPITHDEFMTIRSEGGPMRVVVVGEHKHD